MVIKLNDGPLEFLGGLTDGQVYRCGSYALKFFSGGRDRSLQTNGRALRILAKEYAIGLALYRGGISVPRPYGILELPHPDPTYRPGFFSSRAFPALVMDFIDSLDLTRQGYTSVTFHKDTHLQKLVDQEVTKIKSLGIQPNDVHPCNILWNPVSQQVHLVDFTGWQFI